MGKFFNLDNPIMNFIGKLADTLWLNLLWLITSLPIVTIGPATAALYHVTLSMADDQYVNLTTDFFKGFKDHCKKSIKLGLVLLLMGLVLGIDGYIFMRMKFENVFWTLGFAAYIPISILYLVVCIYAFPLQAMFDNTLHQLLKNALLIGIRYLFCTLSLIVIHVAIFYITINYFTPLIFLGEGLCALLSSYLLRPLFVSLYEVEQ